MIMSMSAIRITETELARDVHAVLEKVQHGIEVVIEQDHRPAAHLRMHRVSKSERIESNLG